MNPNKSKKVPANSKKIIVLEGIKTCPVSVSQVNVIKKTAVTRIIKLNNINFSEKLFLSSLVSNNFEDKIEITNKLNKILESMVSKNPNQWIWSHKQKILKCLIEVVILILF